MRIAYLKSDGNHDHIQKDIAALETYGCDRVVFDSSPRNRPGSRAALLSFLNRMSEGDALIVTSLDQLAGNTSRLLESLADLVSRGITLETISGEIDTGDATTRRLIETFWRFEERSRSGRKPSLSVPEPGGNGAGRPSSLTAAEIARAREMVAGGRPVADVAREFGVSRATIYRSLKKS